MSCGKPRAVPLLSCSSLPPCICSSWSPRWAPGLLPVQPHPAARALRSRHPLPTTTPGLAQEIGGFQSHRDTEGATSDCGAALTSCPRLDYTRKPGGTYPGPSRDVCDSQGLLEEKPHDFFSSQRAEVTFTNLKAPFLFPPSPFSVAKALGITGFFFIFWKMVI